MDAASRNFPNRRSLLRVATFDEEFVDYWENLFDEEDRELAPYFRRVMIRLYIYHAQNKLMYKMDACRFIPVKHASSAKKYIDLAEKKGWIKFIPEIKDKRKTIVQPSDELLQLVERHLLHAVDTIGATSSDLYSILAG